jgi:hypothetical protein
VRLPPGAWLGLRALKFIDPGLEADIYAVKPWAYSPVLVTMNLLRVEEVFHSSLPPWPSKNGQRIQEGRFPGTAHADPGARRKCYADRENRLMLRVTEDMVWDMDFFGTYADFDKFAVQLPGFQISVLPYYDGQVRSIGGMSWNPCLIFINLASDMRT